MSDNAPVAVVYLAWLPYGIGYFKAFLQSYQQFNAGHPHRLYIIFNGIALDHPDGRELYLQQLAEYKIEADTSFNFEGGQDIEAYRKAALSVKEEKIIFLNTFSQLQSENWLQHYHQNFSGDVGIISASGSWQSYYSSVFQKNPKKWEHGKGFKYNFRKYKLFLKAFFYWRFLFKPFPNAHLRTNAFMIRRKDFLAVPAGPLTTKFEAYQFENGRNSLTNFFIKKGMKVLVLDKHGLTYEPSEWRMSNTFWIGNQENLLVTDNQSTIYSEANAEEKETMTTLAWGK